MVCNSIGSFRSVRSLISCLNRARVHCMVAGSENPSCKRRMVSLIFYFRNGSRQQFHRFYTRHVFLILSVVWRIRVLATCMPLILLLDSSKQLRVFEVESIHLSCTYCDHMDFSTSFPLSLDYTNTVYPRLALEFFSILD